MNDKDKVAAELPPLPGCNRIFSRTFVSEAGSVVPPQELPAKNLSHIFRFGHGYHYAHMAVVTAISSPRTVPGPSRPGSAGFHNPDSNSSRGCDPVLMSAWQAAPGVPADELGKQRFAVEGLKDQRILYALSLDGGETWSIS